ncbi:MAG: class I SAM-dependent methyltransferase [Alphaproteobacteria bacterium]|nr:class I SAM-dependent methyltransferase [Alphaproteobacteria bacterium]
MIELKSFYASRIGQIACRVVRRHIARLWPEGGNDTIIGIGFATPYLRQLSGTPALTAAVMPGAQGVIHWPGAKKPNLSLLADEAELPFPDNSVDKVLLAHVLEHTDMPDPLMEEIWRVLTPGGKLLVVVPNRRSVWAQMENTPFGHGRPFSMSQLRRLLEDNRFTATASATVLYIPPTNFRFIQRWWDLFERIGSCLGSFGGALIMEAEKQIYAVKPAGKLARKRRVSYVPSAQPAMRT